MTADIIQRTSRRKWAVVGIVLAVVSGLVGILAWPFLAAFTDTEELQELVADAGGRAPAVFIALQVLQVLVAPIPGQVTSLVGGVLFGTLWGVVYTMIGATIGFTLIFVVTRRLGRPFVERFVSPRLMERFDYLNGTGGALALFVIFLLPGFPDDVISFIAGLTRLRIPTLLLVSLAGRLPGYVVLSATGSGMTYDNMNPIVVSLAVMVAVAALGYWKRALLNEMVRSDNMIAFLRDRWTLSPMVSTLLFVAIVVVGVLLYLAATVEPIIPLEAAGPARVLAVGFMG